jgi:hypothetical protein
VTPPDRQLQSGEWLENWGGSGNKVRSARSISPVLITVWNGEECEIEITSAAGGKKGEYLLKYGAPANELELRFEVKS